METIAQPALVTGTRPRPCSRRQAAPATASGINASAENPSPKWSSTTISSSACCFSSRSSSPWRRSLVERLIAPRKRSLAKGDTYECGVKTYGETWVRFRIQYYIYALMFVVFDIETVFLFPGRSATPGSGPSPWSR